MRQTWTTITNVAFYQGLKEDAEEHQTNWTLNRNAKPGDTVLLYVCAPVSAIVAVATVETEPELCDDPSSEWFRSYFADMHGLYLLRKPIPRDALLEFFPLWRYWKQPRTSARVPEQFTRQIQTVIALLSPEAHRDVSAD